MEARSCSAVALAAALAALACAQPAQRRYEQRLDSAPPASRHGVHSERLRELMRGLDRLQHERLPQAMDAAHERKRRLEEVVRIALEMAGSAAQIRERAADAGLDPAARAEFDRYAEELALRARALADEAAQPEPEQLSEPAGEVVEVCDACHARFRIPLDPPGA